jgi:hypothetical protein
VPRSQYTMPPVTSGEEYRIGWLKESVREGETFIRNATASIDMSQAKDIIAGVHQNKIPQQLSRMNVNLQKRLIRDIVSTMSNLRPLWGYDTDNKELDKQSVILNRLLLNWYQNTYADRAIKKALQYAAVMGTGWIGPDWKSNYWTRGRGEIILNVTAPEDLLPVQMPKDHNIQRAYAVTIREEVPINLARSMFPTQAHRIHPDRDAPGGLRKGISRMGSFLSPVLNRFAADQRSRKAVDTVYPVVDIYSTYVMDLSVNEGPVPRVMGEPDTYWNYTVPVLGHDIADPRTGKPRKAGVEDSMLYPFRRLITWTNSCLLRDDTSYWWHGMVPRVKMTFDAWAWEFLGYSMTRDLNSIEESNNSISRAIDDSANARLRPTLVYDDKTLSKSLVESVDPRQPGQAIGVDFTISERPIRPMLEAGYYDVPQWIFQVVQDNRELMKYLSGVNDYTAITKAAQIPSSDSLEKIMNMAGALVQDVSREMEASLGQLGEMIKAMFFEFYTAPRRLQIMGPDGITKEDTDYFEPSTLFPSHMPWESKDTPSTFSVVQRARHYMDSFFFSITPNSLHRITQMSTKLLYIQLQKLGLPIDPWTMAKINDIPNFGPPPDGTTTVFERWVAFERIKGDLQAHIQAQAQQILAAGQMQTMIQGAMAQAAMGGGAPGGGGPPGALPQSSPSQALGQNAPGRPPDVGANPVIESKDGGTRSTITSK